MELEWKRFSRKYVKYIDNRAYINDFIRPVEQDAYVGRMITNIAAVFVVDDESLNKQVSQRNLKAYSKAKKLHFLLGIIDYLEDKLEKVNKLALKYIDKP
jgi:hypothetical protein